jgi:quercetin dioxygenase-like cupin family protein
MSINSPNRSTAVAIDPSGPKSIVLMPGGGETLTGMGVTMTLRTTGAQSAGQWLVIEYTAPPQFSGPPPHWHKIMTEIFYVLEGTLTLSAGDETIQAGPGGYAFVPPGTVHGFSNQTDAPARYLLIASPAGLENYFAELKAMLEEEPAWPPQDMSKLVALMARYDTFAPPVAA